jgi:hypothetical protein
MQGFVVAQVEQLRPTVCGGGFFGYYGKGTTAFGFKGFTGGIVEYDSRTGGSLGKLSELGAGGVGGGVINSTSGKYGLAYGELGEIPGVADAGVVAFGNGVGGYAEGGVLGGELGGGAYLNIVSRSGCHK